MPKVEAPNVTLYSGYGSDSPENQQHIQDYSYYREQMNLQSELVMCRYGAVHAVKRMNLPDEQILKALKEITPDSSRHGIIMQWLKSENPFPRPPPAK